MTTGSEIQVPDANRNMDLHVEHVTRVEGHGDIRLNVRNGEIEEAKLHITESPRFFEAMLRGRSYVDAAHITCRICGICSTGHTTASLRASEDALGVQPSEQTIKLRKIALLGEFLQSHVLHVYFLAVPDFFGLGSVFPLIQTHKDVVVRALRLKKLSNDITGAISGRHIHGISMAVNGFTALPNMEQLENVRDRIIAAVPDIEATVEICATLDWPDFERETEYVSLGGTDEYALYDGDIVTSDGTQVPPSAYRSITNEFVVPHSTSKHAKHKRDSYMVGALARFNNNYDKLHPKAKEAAEALGISAPCYKPYWNSVAQVVETVHCAYECLDLINDVLETGLVEEDRSVTVHAGSGVGAVEVPRGILFHDYELNNEGLLTNANCIIPTGQNLANIDGDLRELAPQILDRSQDEIKLAMEMLIRAYDPCISCSVHMLNVEFTE
jgi:sulfhydrogenase subunit alpha